MLLNIADLFEYVRLGKTDVHKFKCNNNNNNNTKK